MANPFKNIDELTRDVESFLSKNRSAIFKNSSRISDFFEMACYNNIVRFYENNGFNVEIKNLIKNKFRYKCSTAGDPNKFSFFTIKTTVGKLNFTYEIRHNINVQSYFENDIFTTPDISIIKNNSILYSDDFYDSSTKYYYIKNSSLITFCEVKNFNPFPELLFNFIGVVNELKPVLLGNIKNRGVRHIAVSLMISGKSNSHAERIITSLQRRYHINILSDLFAVGGATFGKLNIRRLKKI